MTVALSEIWTRVNITHLKILSLSRSHIFLQLPRHFSCQQKVLRRVSTVIVSTPHLPFAPQLTLRPTPGKQILTSESFSCPLLALSPWPYPWICWRTPQWSLALCFSVHTLSLGDLIHSLGLNSSLNVSVSLPPSFLIYLSTYIHRHTNFLDLNSRSPARVSYSIWNSREERLGFLMPTHFLS